MEKHNDLLESVYSQFKEEADRALIYRCLILMLQYHDYTISYDTASMIVRNFLLKKERK